MKVFRVAFLFVFGVAAQTESVPLDFDYKLNSEKGSAVRSFVDTTHNNRQQFNGQDFNDRDAFANECESIREPFPLNLEANSDCIDEYEMLTRKIGETDCKMNSMTFSMTSHKLRAEFPFDDTYCQRPTIDIPNGFPSTWVAHHIEVHLPADHLLHGRRFDGEIQMFHVDRGTQKAELAAVSILLDASDYRDNVYLQEYIDEWEAAAEGTRKACDGSDRRQLRRQIKVAQPHGAMPRDEFLLQGDQSHEFFDQVEPTVTQPSVEQHLRRLAEDMVPRDKMFPYNIWPTNHYYGYTNLITAPPCSSIVAWRVMDVPLVISERQLAAMARLLANYQDPITCSRAKATAEKDDDARVLPQKKKIVHCTLKDFTSELYPSSMK
jgi:carbonic anhydrase